MVGGQPGQIVPEARAKWIRGVAQVINHLLYKHEALHSKSNSANNNNKKVNQLVTVF
jgi:hypothetical protein